MNPREITFAYTVYTQHRDSSAFVCPIPIRAKCAEDAARQRFASQMDASKRETTALLVVDEIGFAYLYPVETTPSIGAPLMVQS